MLSERDFSLQVEDILNLYGWHFAHFRPARTVKGWRTAITGYEGFPDYVAVRNGRLLFFELKSEKGKLTVAQEVWLDVLRMSARCEVRLWYPEDLESIVLILR